ncbi:uncharacterized protein LOC113517059 [Galleria mellonella]|uniref:Uncharacterized protein LOC113517059 n=1 Tax=Galleria mellonella TaxID=7137 RepID=A0A6J1WXC2_GALME|nr:uncharacterized protein LOC113517059 [Galleria mellonella]
MQFEYDPERLIEEVKKRPGIWDFEDLEYRAKNGRYKLWNEVVTELMQNDVKLTKSEMRELELQLQKKWKSIRDCFQKYLANPNRTRKPYIYYKQLQFLLKNQTQPQNNEGEASSESDEVLKPNRAATSWRCKKKLKIGKEEEQSSDDDNDNTENQEESQDYSNDGVDVIIPSKIPKMNKTDEFAFASVDAPSKNELDDPDRMFLLSLLPHLKTIPEELRLNAKMELMQVLQNANYTATRNHKFI